MTSDVPSRHAVQGDRPVSRIRQLCASSAQTLPLKDSPRQDDVGKAAQSSAGLSPHTLREAVIHALYYDQGRFAMSRT